MSLELKKANREIGKTIGFIVLFVLCIGLAIAYLVSVSHSRGSIILMSGASAIWLVVLVYLVMDTAKQIAQRKNLHTENGKYQDH